MLRSNPVPASPFRDSANIHKPQRSAVPIQNNDHAPCSTDKTCDTVLFGGPTQKKEAFNLAEPPKGYSVNNASPSEISEMVDFIEKTFGKTGDRPAYEASCRHALQLGGHSYIIRSATTPGNPIIATALLNPNGYIVLGAVDKAYQGQGIAAAMMAGLIEKGKQAGLDRLYLGVEKSNPYAEVAIRVAQKTGFKNAGDNPDLWLMELCLKPKTPKADLGRNTGLWAFSRKSIQVFPRNGLHIFSPKRTQVFPGNAPPTTFPRTGIQNILIPLRRLKRFFP